jgi:hypothetical protein
VYFPFCQQPEICNLLTHRLFTDDSFSRYPRSLWDKLFKIFTSAPCMLLHLLYSKPTHALLLNTLSHPHFKTLKLFKKSNVKTPLKPYMFRSLLYDRPQGSSFVLSALPLLRLFASSSCLFGVCVRVCVCVCVPTKQLDEANKRRSGNALSTKDEP